MELKRKKAFCFLALKHHSRFLVPVTQELAAQGMEVMYLTAPAEMPFELTLQDEGLPYRHTHAYVSPDVAADTDRAYRQVRGLWKDKLLQSSLLNHFTLPVQDKIVRMHVENYYLFRRMFEVEKPDLVLALHELNSWGKMLAYLSHEFHVPMITLQEGLYYAPAAVYRYHTEYSSACLVWGEATKEVLIRCGGAADKIFVVGNTHLYHAVAQATDPQTLRATYQALEAKSRQKVITLLMGGLGYDKGFTFPDGLLDWIKANPELLVLFKWHPVTNKLAIEKISENVSHLANIRMLQQFDTYRLLAASDICIVFGNSTTGLEALAFNKPLIEVQLPGLDYSFARQGVAEAVSGLAELPAAVEQILKNDVAPNRKRQVEKYLRENLYLLDGKSADRCVGVVRQMLGARESRKKQVPISPLQSPPNFNCSIIIPFLSSTSVMETLLGVVENTPADFSYECLIGAAANQEKLDVLMSSLKGDVRLVLSEAGGQARLCNKAAAESHGRYLCFLSPGWVPQQGWLQTLIKELETNPMAGIVGGMALFVSGLIAHAGVAIDANLSPVKLYGLLPATFHGAHRVRKMRAVKGCLLMRRETFFAAGGFDDAFDGEWSELDLCFEAGRNNWQTIYTPESLFLCLDGAHPTGSERDRLRFFAKWVGELWPDQEMYWAEDQVDSDGLSRLYQTVSKNYAVHHDEAQEAREPSASIR